MPFQASKTKLQSSNRLVLIILQVADRCRSPGSTQSRLSTAPLIADEEQQLHGVIAAVSWVAPGGRPDALASASILSGAFSRRPQDSVESSAVVKHLKENDVGLRIQPIAEDDVRHFVVADSSFDLSGKIKPQHGWIQGVTTRQFNSGHPRPISVIRWRSRQLRRKAGKHYAERNYKFVYSAGSLGEAGSDAAKPSIFQV